MKRTLAAALLLASCSALAGGDFLRITPPLAVQSKKLELVEFFYYGCPQCDALEPFLNDWASHHPEVDLVRVPAFKRAWLPLARAYYALAALDQEARLRSRIFEAIHDEGIDLDDEATLFDWLKGQGVDMARFKMLYHSIDVARKVRDAARMADRIGITGVPSLVVDGKYIVQGDLARGQLLDELMDMAWQARKQ